MRILLTLAALLASVPASAATINIGQTQVFTMPDANNGNLVVAHRVTVPQSCRLLDLSFYAGAAGGQLYLGVYADAAGNPGALLATSAAFAAVVGWNKRVLLTQPQISGAVWLVFHASANTLSARKSGGGQSRYYPRAFGPLPASLSGTVGTDPSQWSFFAACETAPAAPPNAAPGAPAIQFAKFGEMRFAWDYGTEPIDGFRLYVGAGSSGCPGGPHMAVPAAQRAVTVAHLAWDVTQRAQITAVRGGSESGCSNVAAGKPN